MPGAGKSSVGVILAKVLGYEFIDTDLVIQHREKRLLREIIADEGNEGFLAIENEVNATLEADKSVIAPGGSAIYGKEAMEHFKEIAEGIHMSPNKLLKNKNLVEKFDVQITEMLKTPEFGAGFIVDFYFWWDY